MPVREAFWLSEEWRATNLRYYPFYGRGFIQLTWESNYRAAGDAIGTDFVRDPEGVMNPIRSSEILAWFWDTHFIPQFARRHDWRETRRRVQGADAGLNELISHAECLLAA